MWTTDKDGLIPDLLAAEITGKTGKNPAQLHQEQVERFGESWYSRIDTPTTLEQKQKFANLNADDVTATTLGGEDITAILTKAPGNDAPIGGIKVVTEANWFAARPSGPETIYKVYAESCGAPAPGTAAQRTEATPRPGQRRRASGRCRGCGQCLAVQWRAGQSRFPLTAPHSAIPTGRWAGRGPTPQAKAITRTPAIATPAAQRTARTRSVNCARC